jgi:hypothetical protein
VDRRSADPAVIVDWMSHVLDPIHGRVERWYLPGTHSLNFLLENALGGGGVASLRIDPQGKAFAQQLLEIQIRCRSASPTNSTRGCHHGLRSIFKADLFRFYRHRHRWRQWHWPLHRP